MARLRIYTVHVNPSLPHPYEAAEFVAEGFSWKAFFFTGLWTLYHRLWWQVLAIAIYNVFMLNLLDANTLSGLGIMIIDIGVRIFIGFEANEWLRVRLKKRGYLTADIAAGDSPLRAELRFFDRYLTAHPDAIV